jgi:protein-S-isoprenylcysteine O-methyltransferase Ste14
LTHNFSGRSQVPEEAAMTTRAGHTQKAGAVGGLPLQLLIGSGDKILLFTLPFLLVGVLLNALFRSSFEVGGPPLGLGVLAAVVLIVGATDWAWCITLIVRKVPRGELITTGPYSIVKHPLYAGVALLVLPWIGFLCDTWLGAMVGAAMYFGSRIFAPAEETKLATTFGARWDEYRNAVKLPWL